LRAELLPSCVGWESDMATDDRDVGAAAAALDAAVVATDLDGGQRPGVGVAVPLTDIAGVYEPPRQGAGYDRAEPAEQSSH
jgi:hypothetical protein